MVHLKCNIEKCIGIKYSYNKMYDAYNIFIIKHKPSYGLITSILASRNVPTISRACIMKLCILILFRMVFFDSGKFLECIFDKRLIFHSIKRSLCIIFSCGFIISCNFLGERTKLDWWRLQVSMGMDRRGYHLFEHWHGACVWYWHWQFRRWNNLYHFIKPNW